MTVVETVKEAIGLDGGEFWSSVRTYGVRALTRHRARQGHEGGNVTGQTTTSIPRQLCASSDSPQPVPTQDVVHAVEVRGKCGERRIEVRQLTHDQNERHTYEKCQYDEFKERVAKMDELRAAKGGARSN